MAIKSLKFNYSSAIYPYTQNPPSVKLTHIPWVPSFYPIYPKSNPYTHKVTHTQITRMLGRRGSTPVRGVTYEHTIALRSISRAKIEFIRFGVVVLGVFPTIRFSLFFDHESTCLLAYEPIVIRPT
jgi:hypothetical protein